MIFFAFSINGVQGCPRDFIFLLALLKAFNYIPDIDKKAFENERKFEISFLRCLRAGSPSFREKL